MPKLSQAQVEAAKNAPEGEDFGERQWLPTADGQTYVYRLISVEACVSKAGNPQWKWTLTLSEDHHPEYINAGYLERLWHYTPLTEGQEWRIGTLLTQFGYTATSDTDELINERAIITAHVVPDEYNGTKSMKLKRFAAYDSDLHPAVKPDESEFNDDQF